MGNITSEFVAVELSKIDKKYVNTERTANGVYITLPDELPSLQKDELVQLLNNIKAVLVPMFGPYYARKIIKRIEGELSIKVEVFA